MVHFLTSITFSQNGPFYASFLFIFVASAYVQLTIL